jgi:hypothetical protein
MKAVSCKLVNVSLIICTSDHKSRIAALVSGRKVERRYGSFRGQHHSSNYRLFADDSSDQAVEWPNSKPLKPLPWFAASVCLYLSFWHSLVWI